MFIPFILLLSAYGILCDFECVQRERENCDPNLIPKDFPETAEELRTICSILNTYGTCIIQVFETCGYGENYLNKLRTNLDFMKSACDEDHHIFKAVSSNLGCITPIARKIDVECNQSRFAEENYNAIMKHEEQVSENFDRLEVISCLSPLWEISCRSIVLGFHCGSDVKQAVEEFLKGTNDRYKDSCSKEILEEIQPLVGTYRFAIEAEQNLKNAIENRK